MQNTAAVNVQPQACVNRIFSLTHEDNITILRYFYLIKYLKR